MKPTTISRRTVLRGLVGGALATVALPTLEAMLDSNGGAHADGSALPVRLVVWCFGNGVVLNRWVPGGIRAPVVGANYPLSPELQPFQSVAPYVTVCSGFDNRCPFVLTHHEGMTIFSGHSMADVAQATGIFSNARGPSMDQLAAAAIGGLTTIPSLQLGCVAQVSQVDLGTTMHNLSHKDYLQPLPPVKNPQAVYSSLAGLFLPADDPNKPARLGVVDAVREDLRELKRRLGQADRTRMDAHIAGMAELETKINALPPICTLPAMPEVTSDVASGVRAVNEAMSDLITFAFSCDLTRIVSYYFLGGASPVSFPELGGPPLHAVSHAHSTNALAAGAPPYSESGMVEEMHAGVVYEMEMAAYLAKKLASTTDPTGGNLLDRTALFVSSDCSEGFSHSLIDFPILVIGKAGGRLRSGHHFRAPDHRNASDVLLSVLQAIVPEATEVGSLAPKYLIDGAPDPAYSNTPFTEMKTGV